MFKNEFKINWLNLMYATLLPIVVAVNIYALYKVQTISDQNKENTVQILNNQHRNSTAVEAFFRGGLVCILTIPPNAAPSKTLITNEVNGCFKNTPPIK